jgi:1,4-alpha-glucan branching enzyme
MSENQLTNPSAAEAARPAPAQEISLLTRDDVYLFNEGSHFRLYEKLGAHPVEENALKGVYFAVWAPNAEAVSVIGDFNGWDKHSHPLRPRESSGIWEGIIPQLEKGALYKYHIISRFNNYQADKADPFAFFNQIAPEKASVVWDLDYDWQDRDWMAGRSRANAFDAAIAVYEVHPGSWQRVPEEDSRFLTYRELAPRLAEYVLHMGFTHVEFLPIMEHPFYGSWGYQTLGYFSPTSRYGTPQDFMFLIDYLHQHGIGVILDWVPSHFPSDEHGLGFFDGSHLFEHADPRKGFHPDWNSYIFNYGRNEVQSYLISSALFWLDKYHADGFRVDAVASMLYLDYSRKEGEWIPNQYGGHENLDAIAFLRRFNEEVHVNYPQALTVAEESTAWPMVSRPAYTGGLGFDMKWDMGWMHDTLEYMSKEPIHRSFHHNKLNFRMLYAYTENYVLPLSHDEVVHGKGSLLAKMSGDEWQKFANLRVLLGYMYGQPGKKMLFMGAEIGQWREWGHDRSLD